MKFLWLDTETTGLDPKEHTIIAVGALFTDARLNPISEPFEVVIQTPHGFLSRMDDAVTQMHVKSGLLEAVRASTTTLHRAEHDLLDFITSNTQGRKSTFLAGSSIHFDRAFLAEQMPLVLDHVSHRMVDVSTLKVLATAWGYSGPKGYEAQHTPVADIHGSIMELKHWVNGMMPDISYFLARPNPEGSGDWRRG